MQRMRSIVDLSVIVAVDAAGLVQTELEGPRGAYVGEGDAKAGGRGKGAVEDGVAVNITQTRRGCYHFITEEIVAMPKERILITL